MSIDLVKKAMSRFLADATPEVLCIKGRWGTGKTYTWQQAVSTASASQAIALKRYSSISLFGLKNSSDIIQTIYANTVDLTDKKALPQVLGGLPIQKIIAKAKALTAFGADHANIPYVAALGGVARAIIAQFVNETLVCIDDFERKSDHVSVNEVMGTIAQLRDLRKCKVVLILNEDSF